MAFYQFQKRFPNDDACRHQIMVSRYGGTEIPCPKCQRDSKFHRMKRQWNYVCRWCGHHLYPRRDTYGTLSDIASQVADETYLGGSGQAGNVGAEPRKKLWCSGCWNEPDDIMANVVPNAKKKTLQPIMKTDIESDRTVYTNELRSYTGLGKAGFTHATVNHGAK